MWMNCIENCTKQILVTVMGERMLSHDWKEILSHTDNRALGEAFQSDDWSLVCMCTADL